MRKTTAALLALAAIAAFVGLSAGAVRAQEETETPLQVGISEHPPLSIPYEDGWDGIAVQLWQRVAGDLDVEYEWVELAVGQETEAVRRGLVDVVITGVVTAGDEAEVDFTHSYFESSLGYVESRERQIVEILRSVFRAGFWRTAGVVALVLLVVGALTWLLERKANPEDFGGSWARGLWSGFWFAAVTMTAVGFGDKVPKTVLGRAVALFWMLFALGITATLTATIITAIALQESSSFSFPEDLRGLTVGAAGSTLSAGYLAEREIDFESYPSTEEGLRAVNAGEIRVFVDEEAALRYYNDALFDATLPVVVAAAGVQRYAFALPDGDPLREALNRAILTHISSGSWPDLLRRFGSANGS